MNKAIGIISIFCIGFGLGRLVNSKALLNQKQTIITLKRQLTNAYTNRYYRDNLSRNYSYDSDSTNAEIER
jgi:hypothetical protein